MSLDFYLESEAAHPTDGEPQIFIRRDGQMLCISRDEWDRLFPGLEPVTVRPDEESQLNYGRDRGD